MDERHGVEASRFVEEVGLAFEQLGLPRMAGRILGRLVIADVPEQSSSDLAEALQASKGSISTMTRLLIQLGLIERVGRRGDRRDYFRLRPNLWPRLVRQRAALFGVLRQAAERGLRLVSEESGGSAQRLREMRDLFAFLEQEIPLALARWQRASDQHAPTAEMVDQPRRW